MSHHIRQDDLLFIAAEDSSPDALKILLASGINVNIKTNLGETPLMRAAESGNLQNVELLCDSGADINAETNYGWTAAIFAARKGHSKIVEYLLDKGHIDVNKEYGHNRETLLDEAVSAYHPHPEIVKLLLSRGADVNHQGAGGYYPLWGARLEIVKLLCEAGANVNLKNESGETALSRAAMSADLDIVKYLLERGADINNRDQSGDTPLMYAASKENIKLVEFLIEKGASVDDRGKYGDTPLLRASRWGGHVEIAKCLLDKGANINAKDADGNTSVMNAAINGFTKMLELLVERKADLSATNKENKIAIDLVKSALFREKNRSMDMASTFGCDSFPYLADRIRDGMDVFTFTVNSGLGARARAGPVSAGCEYLLADYGLGGGKVGVIYGGPGSVEFGSLFDITLMSHERFFVARDSRNKSYESGGIFLISAAETKSSNDIFWPYFTQVEAVAGFGGGIRMGLNLGEMIDFILGWTTIDIYGDDAGIIKEEKTKLEDLLKNK
ncbi:MAG: hypothetical protein A2X48_01325 [Lentisphaerae bacterium GWF2_49_21]|nr:MAG: hypothetical protein A2X48_01325 [Lentisphaerae bacterium GWF2_49_21]